MGALWATMTRGEVHRGDGCDEEQGKVSGTRGEHGPSVWAAAATMCWAAAQTTMGDAEGRGKRCRRRQRQCAGLITCWRRTAEDDDNTGAHTAVRGTERSKSVQASWGSSIYTCTLGQVRTQVSQGPIPSTLPLDPKDVHNT
jgi:hypothetical protein